MACLWCLELLLLVTCYTDLHKVKEQELKESLNQSNGISPNETPPSYDSVTSTRLKYSVSTDVENIQSGEDHEKQIVEQTVEEPLDIRKEKLTMKFFYKSNYI